MTYYSGYSITRTWPAPEPSIYHSQQYHRLIIIRKKLVKLLFYLRLIYDPEMVSTKVKAMLFCVSAATVGVMVVLLYTLRMEDVSKYTAFPSGSTEAASPMQSLIWRKSGRSLFIARLDAGLSLPRDKPPPYPRRQPPTHGGYGYVLAQRYADQLTGGAVNVANLMCLATQLGRVRVVEPFLINSRFGLPAGQNWTSEPKFTNLYDATKWKEYGSGRNYSQLVPYETFLEDAPRKVIIVQYSRSHLCDENKVVLKKAHYYCKSNGFEVVRNVCVTYGSEGILTTAAFKNQVYGELKPKNVVVLFISYGGIQSKPLTKVKETHRLFVKCNKCSRHEHAMEDIEPSSSVYSDAETYIAKYLNGSPSYITVMIRVEYLMNKNKCFEVNCLRTCLKDAVSNLRDVKKRTGLNTVFLAIDVGTFGSDILIRPEKKVIVTEPVEELLKEVFDNTTSLHRWEETFATVGFGRTRSSGYIAMMQKVIAAKGDVLMLVGSREGSSFQRTCRTLYHRIHDQGQIIEPVPKCPPIKS